MNTKIGLSQILLYFLMLMFMMVIGCGDGADDFKLPKYHDADADKCTISGRVTYKGVGRAGITVLLSGYSNATVATDENGEYRFDDVDGDQAYVVSPSRGTLIFTPESRGVEPDGSNVDGVDFEAMDCCGDDTSEEEETEEI